MKRIMNKKLLCMLLCLVMLLSVTLTACSEKTKDELAEDIQKEASEEALTLAMYLMSEKPVHPDTAKEIEDAVNVMTKAKFTTQMKLYFYTENEYYEKLEAAFAARDEAKKNGTLGNVSASADTAADGEVSVEIKYPEIADYQVDIFYLGGYDRYAKYTAESRLSNLGFEISDSGGSNQIKKFISPYFLSALQGMGGRQGQTYAIPTNKTIGEYTYLLLNKEALNVAKRRVDGVAMDKSPYTSLTCNDTADFLEFVKAYLGESYAPLYTNVPEQELLLSNLQFWGIDEAGELSDAFSVLGNYYDGNASYQKTDAYKGEMVNLFEDDEFVEDLTTLNHYKVDGFYRAADDTRDFAVGYVKGGAELEEIYGDEYEMVVLEKPTLTAEDIYSDMFGVAYCTTDVSRSMEIITYLNTNEEIRNLLLYGVEGTHYQMVSVGADGSEIETDDKNEDEDEVETYKVVRRLLVDTELEYKMSIHKTGNELLAYPEEGTDPRINEFGVKQNRDAKVDLYCGFTVNYGDFGVNVEELRAIKTLSDSLLTRYLACDSAEALATYLAEAKAEVAASSAVANQMKADGEGSLAACYAAWKKAMKITK